MGRTALVAVITGDMIDSKGLRATCGDVTFGAIVKDAVQSVKWDYLPENIIYRGDSFWGMLHTDPAQALVVVDQISHTLRENFRELGSPNAEARFAVWVGYVDPKTIGDHENPEYSLSRAFHWSDKQIADMKEAQTPCRIAQRCPEGFQFAEPPRPDTMTRDHPQWAQFVELLKMSLTDGDLLYAHNANMWYTFCDCTLDKTRAVLRTNFPTVDAATTIAYLQEHGGYCDCEVLMNVAERDWLVGLGV